MADITPTETVEVEEVNESETVEVEDSQADAGPQQDDPAAGLKSALQKERAQNKANLKRIKDLEREAADRDKTPDQKAIDDARREAAAEATAVANKRLVAAEFRVEAAKRVKDPRIALKLVDLAEIDVDEDGNVDGEGITAALDALLAEYPDLAPSRFDGTADQGAHSGKGVPVQLTRDQLSNMSAEQIEKARNNGQLNKLLGIKN